MLARASCHLLAARRPAAAALSTSAAASMPLPGFEPEGHGVMRCEEGGGTIQGLEMRKPLLGAWPNVEPGVNKPDQARIPDPPPAMAETKRPIIGGVTESTLIEQFDEVRGTSDLNDNSSYNIL